MWNIILRVTTSKFENRLNPEKNPSQEYRFEMSQEPTQEVLRLLEDAHNKVRNPTSAVVVNVFYLEDGQ